ncbi:MULTISPECIES: dipeptidase [unclassified Sphingopyxis]|jgi:membrane dipeptidase|uniref:dipeptidase n=1 Tax=unclassified Sphingopyxis TaxID=2614943 RepID=UPI0006C244C3|nr:MULTISPECIES: membrane dipeptidase [unclassified Sphingopyxis]USI77962.1 dipeptidase [Sphingopyxis sp. USTB-05]GAO79670.1 microsomal dipeptidase [Sphingopyxis sp. C-1]
MDRRNFILSGAALSATMALAPAAAALAKTRPLTFDAMGEVRFEYDAALIGQMRASGLDAITITLCDPKAYEGQAYEEAIQAVLDHDAHIAKHPELFLKATKTGDIDVARAHGQLALFYLFQNSTQFGRDLDNVDLFYKLGVRSAQITYNDQNWAGAGCKELGSNGLTHFGRDLVGRMNERRMLIDLSHSNMQTMADTITASKVPVIISHTACMAVHSNIRNTTDANLRLLADKGGVAGICQMRPFLTTKRDDALPEYFRHIDHAVKVMGADHVAIGSDRDHRVVEMTDAYIAELKAEEGANFHEPDWPLFINELNGPRRMEVVWDGVRKLGYPASTVEKIMGTNVRRIYQEVIG